MNDGVEATRIDDEQSGTRVDGASGRDDLARLPPLAVVTALAAFSAMGIKRLTIPALSGWVSDESIFSLGRYGAFFANLTGVAGLVCLCVALFGFVRNPENAGLRRRLLIATFAGIFLPTIALATFFPREHTTGEMVLFAIGAANVLVVAVAMNAARFADSLLGRAVGVLCAGTALFAFPAQTLRVLVRYDLDAWQLKAVSALRNTGELGYLLVLLVVSVMVFPAARGRRDSVARVIAFFVLIAVSWGCFEANETSRRDFADLVHLAQRVEWFIETLPIVYTLPLSIALGSCLGAFVGSDPIRKQAAVGLFILVSAGYAPGAPERLLTFTLAMTLVARAVIALSRRGAQSEAT